MPGRLTAEVAALYMLSGRRGFGPPVRRTPERDGSADFRNTDIGVRAVDLAWFIGVGGICVRLFDIVIWKEERRRRRGFAVRVVLCLGLMALGMGLFGRRNAGCVLRATLWLGV